MSCEHCAELERRLDSAEKKLRVFEAKSDDLADAVIVRASHVTGLCNEGDDLARKLKAAESRLDKALELAAKISNTYGFAESWNPQELLKMSDNIIRECSPRVVERQEIK